MSPKISIVIPVFNAERYLHQCLDSVLSQTFKNFEVILVNDGSTDSSGKICNDYQDLDSRVKVIHQSNHGSSCSHNSGYDCSKSE